MAEEKVPIELDQPEEFKVCRECGYDGGFHVIFLRREPGEYRMDLKCPGCAQVYKLGLMVNVHRRP